MLYNELQKAPVSLANYGGSKYTKREITHGYIIGSIIIAMLIPKKIHQ